MPERFLSHLGLARRAGKILIGQDQLQDGKHRDDLFLIVMTEDAGSTVRRKTEALSERRQIPLLVAFDRDELGRALGVGRCSIVGIIDKGFADALINKAPDGSKVAGGPEEQGIDG
ncbi:MAG TPA: L7Ae/L30e/S12e/Gadd45 family protein [Fastidiosipila sp.]|nr:L7Ae/L30e/S12e/Gadd45 family protein [Fastidiosipila sp.]